MVPKLIAVLIGSVVALAAISLISQTTETVRASSWMAITGGGIHTCAVNGEGGVECWGENAVGRLGAETTDLCGRNEDTPCSRTPVSVSGLDGGVSLRCGEYDTVCRT